jgi:hypothetical protein
MERTITVSEQTYRALQRQATRSQKTVETLVEGWLEERLTTLEPDKPEIQPGRDRKPITYQESSGKAQVLRETGTAGQETVTIELPGEVYDGLQQLAAEDQLGPVEELACLVKRAQLLGMPKTLSGEAPASTEPNPLQVLASLAQDLGVDDLAEQHDHYLYGVEKR